MLHKRRWLTGALCAMLLSASVSAAEHPLSPADFGEELTGVWITGLPEENALLLGSRVIRAGDVLTADQLRSLTLQDGAETVIRYLPIRESSLLYRILFMPFPLSWFFYLPSQVLIALSASRSKR